MTLPLDTTPFFTGDALSFAATGLPAGLSIDPATGVISGAPTTEGTSSVTVTATNVSGQAGQNFNWTIVPAAGGGGGITAEAGAAGHWVFGTDHAGMTDLVSNQVMAELISGTSSLTPNTVVISDGDGSAGQAQRGLVSPRTQQSEQTICAVVSSTASGNRIVAGNLSTTDGAGLFTFGVDLFGNARGFPFNNRNFDPGTPTSAPFIFVAMSISASQNWVLFRGGPTGSVAVTGEPLAAPQPITAPLGIGNTNYASSSFSAGGSYAEFIVFDGFQGTTDLEGIYQRSKARLAGRGITVL
ncbi:MAG: Ig domain-containing protein [Paracoccaceae bacterium]